MGEYLVNHRAVIDIWENHKRVAAYVSSLTAMALRNGHAFIENDKADSNARAAFPQTWAYDQIRQKELGIVAVRMSSDKNPAVIIGVEINSQSPEKIDKVIEASINYQLFAENMRYKNKEKTPTAYPIQNNGKLDFNNIDANSRDVAELNNGYIVNSIDSYDIKDTKWVDKKNQIVEMTFPFPIDDIAPSAMINAINHVQVVQNGNEMVGPQNYSMKNGRLSVQFHDTTDKSILHKIQDAMEDCIEQAEIIQPLEEMKPSDNDVEKAIGIAKMFFSEDRDSIEAQEKKKEWKKRFCEMMSSSISKNSAARQIPEDIAARMWESNPIEAMETAMIMENIDESIHKAMMDLGHYDFGNTIIPSQEEIEDQIQENERVNDNSYQIEEETLEI